MRLSAKIYPMVIYIGTLIIVTLGTDYMLEIFIAHQELPEIESIEIIADMDLNSRVDPGTYMILENFASRDDSMKRVLDLTIPHDVERTSRERNSFRYSSSMNSLPSDETINRSISGPEERFHVVASYEKFRVDRVKIQSRLHKRRCPCANIELFPKFVLNA
ncbi:hypothetical protein QAD02_017978 [Eretmocerus hayati]|uniref:Uncharacterized protein n=1 Tax=Eretmocerus hayati TaxID=131215 RepID=A0ACC2PGM7_9HYME|nr:hypothetical protein QAD02_017978 [Eretmocerus hayati]